MLSLLLLCPAGCDRGIDDAVHGRNGMVVSGDSIASRVGLEILRAGGNAVDAAVATAFALAVTYPEAGNLGGGGFIVLWRPDSGGSSIDFRERAPAAATADMYRGDPSGSVNGCLAAGVPGTVAGLLQAMERFGSLSLPAVLQPAIDLARNGIPVTRRLSEQLLGYDSLISPHPSTVRVFYDRGSPLREGTVLRQEDLAQTLERIRDEGWAGFYRGRTAELIVGQMKRDGGLIGLDDLASYGANILPPVTGTYRGHTIISMGLPSSGGLCLLKSLQLLEPFDLAQAGFHTVRGIHLVTEAMKRAYAMRAAFLGDPEYVRVEIDRLMESGGRIPEGLPIDEVRATPADSLSSYPLAYREGTETTHLSVIDRDGMAVALTYTINDLFGCKVVVDSAGFFLNDEMDDFVTTPGRPNIYGLVGGAENMIEPGKRPLSSMSPTIVLKEDKPVLILGARGGARIISSLLQVVLNVVDHGMDPVDAVNAPRFHHQWSPDKLLCENGIFTPEVARNLEEMGHKVGYTTGTIGQLEVIWVDQTSGEYFGIPDPREGGAAAGY